MANNSKIVGIILSGGAGRRLGGVDKGLQNYQSKPLIEQVIQQIQPQVDELLLCVNRNQQHYAEYGFPLICDQEPQSYQGPLAGIYAAIKYLNQLAENNSYRLLISSCDSPNLPSDHAQKLLSALSNSAASSSVVYDGHRTQNLHCLIKQSAFDSLLDFYETGGRAMHQWHKKNASIEVDFSEQAACFLNVNSMDKFK